MSGAINTHGVRIEFGKYFNKETGEGELFTRLPRSYLTFMINNGTKQADIAKAEFERRGDTMPVVELSGHAIDGASFRVLGRWKATRNDNEGLYSWLQRMTLEALEHGTRLETGKIKYNGMKFVIFKGEEFPTLKTIMAVKNHVGKG